MNPADDVLPCYTLPQAMSNDLGQLILRTYTNFEVGLGDGCQRDRDGKPVIDTSGRVATVPYDRSQNDLVGESKCWKACSPGFPVFSGGAIVAVADYDDTEANFDHLERGLRCTNPATGQTLLICRLPGDAGRKRGGKWRATVEFVL